ncbi:hypothetical protein CDEST_04334 [Colletotrichum destructivum]|uniref:Uncharacterized protein n=1 Tax=Colletotrichum destructivum TaxID=34406 RepID=A0AAX4I8L2_9PEZI|nr:hypothetical protein CDEST_04334 [Colletotrichum destructivum]
MTDIPALSRRLSRFLVSGSDSRDDVQQLARQREDRDGAKMRRGMFIEPTNGREGDLQSRLAVSLKWTSIHAPRWVFSGELTAVWSTNDDLGRCGRRDGAVFGSHSSPFSSYLAKQTERQREMPSQAQPE